MNTVPSETTIGLFDAQIDMGVVTPPGRCDYSAEQQTYTLTSAGQNIWGDHDDFHFVYKRFTGDFIVTTRATFIGEGVNPHRKLGWMVRASLATDAPNVSTGVHGDGLLSIQFRRTPGGETEEKRMTLVGADVIQLERRGNTYIMSAAHYGDPFVTVQVDDLDLGDEVYVGLLGCSHEVDVQETVVYRDVRWVKPVAAGFDRGRDPFTSHLEILDVTTGHRDIIYSEDAVFEAPNWTRDGKALIYNRGGLLYRFDLATRIPTQIESGRAIHCNNDHVLSFDGSMLAISSHSEETHNSLVYTLPVEGGVSKRVTPVGPSYLHGWSADDKFLVYAAQRDGIFNIYRIPVEGGAEDQLTHTPGLDDGPEYTPDGRYIYFCSVRSGLMQVWRMKPDSSDPEQMTDDAYNNWFPHVSPDGKWVVFISYLVGEVEASDHPAAKRVYLRLMPVDGGEPKVLAYVYGGQGTINVPSWSPDSRKIAFVSNSVPVE